MIGKLFPMLTHLTNFFNLKNQRNVCPRHIHGFTMSLTARLKGLAQGEGCWIESPPPLI